MKKIIAFFKQKKFKYGSLSIVFTAIFITGVIMLNIVAGLILERLDVTFDLTPEGMFSIEQDTIDFLSGITDNVTITVCSRENDFVNSSPNVKKYYNQTNEILKRFAGTTPNITLKYIDLMSNPDFASKYDRLNLGSIIIESENTERYKILDAEDYFNITYYDMRNGSQISEEEYHMLRSFRMTDFVHTDVSAGAESALLSAILSVTDVSPVHVGLSLGYGESRNEQMEILLERNAYTIHPVDLITSDIDPDLDFIIINSPSTDFSLGSISKIAAWLDNNGEFGKSLMYIAHNSAETPNLDSFLEEWGIEIERAYVMQADSRYTAPVAGLDFPIQYYNPVEFGEGLNPSYRIFGELLRHTHQKFEAWQNIETTPILAAYSGAVLVTFEDFEGEGMEAPEERGAYTVGVMSSKMRFEELDVFKSNVIAFGGLNIFSPVFMGMRNSNNAEYFISMMNEINGKDGIIAITPKSFTIATFQISGAQAQMIGLTFTVFLPLAIIAAGVIIWIRRRHR
jgi:hypothetical protein